MNYKLIILTNQINEDKKPILITAGKAIFKQLKTLSQNTKVSFKINFESLNLGQVLYGNSKQESIKIQKKNAKIVLKLYAVVKKVVKLVKKLKLDFDGTIYVDRLDEKKNNNDLMLISMLNVDFNTNCLKKMKVAYEGACDFFDAENSLNKMCDFHDNHCTKHRDKGIDKTTGCCPNFCKIRVPGAPCAHKNLACKIFMCDYLINEKGYYFTPNTVPVLKKNMTALERATCFGSLCRTEKKSLKNLWLFRIQTTLYFILLIIVILFLFFSF